MVANGSKLHADFVADFICHSTHFLKPFGNPVHDLVLLLCVSSGHETIPAGQLFMAGVLDLQQGGEVRPIGAHGESLPRPGHARAGSWLWEATTKAFVTHGQIETLRDSLVRFVMICSDQENKIDPADRKRIGEVEKIIGKS